MSILLESLKQSSDKDDKEIPGVGDSHFDDEMLSDEWLLEKLRMWKIISASLFLGLVITSTGWIVNLNKTTSEQLSTKTNSFADSTKSEQVILQKPAKSIEDDKVASMSELESAPIKQKYVPKKITKSVNSSENSGASQVKSNSMKNANSEPSQTNLASLSKSKTGTIIDFESLSSEQRNEMPELEISSYAVSSNNKKSFVVLNGAFYGQGEIIAPNLVLVSIEKESIVVRYFDQLIRKKYGL